MANYTSPPPVSYMTESEMLDCVEDGCVCLFPEVSSEAYKALRGFPPSTEKYKAICYGLETLDSRKGYYKVARAIIDAARWPKNRQPLTEEQKAARYKFLIWTQTHVSIHSTLATILCLFDSGEPEDLFFIEKLSKMLLTGNHITNSPEWVEALHKTTSEMGYATSATSLFIHMIRSKPKGSISADTITEWYKTGNAILKSAAVAAIGTVYKLTWDADDVAKIDTLIRRGEYPVTPFSFVAGTSPDDAEFAPSDVIHSWLDKIDSLMESPKGFDSDGVQNQVMARRYAIAILNFSRVFDIADRTHIIGVTEGDILYLYKRIVAAFVKTNLVSPTAKTWYSHNGEHTWAWGLEPMELFMRQPLIRMETIESWALGDETRWKVAAVYSCSGRTLSDRMAAWLLDNYLRSPNPLSGHINRVLFPLKMIGHKAANPPVFPENALADAIERAASDDSVSKRQLVCLVSDIISPAFCRNAYYMDLGHDETRRVWPQRQSIPAPRLEQWLKSSDKFLVDVAMRYLRYAVDDGEKIPESIVFALSKRKSKEAKELIAGVMDYEQSLVNSLRHTCRVVGRPDPETLLWALHHKKGVIRAEGLAALRPYMIPRGILEDAKKSINEYVQRAVMTACRDYCYKVDPGFTITPQGFTDDATS